jgi:hypothetical protein
MSPDACDILDEFRTKKTYPEYYTDTAKKVRSTRISLLFLHAVASTLFSAVLFGAGNRKERLTWTARKWFDFLVESRRRVAALGFHRGLDTRYKYVYFPLHVDPEASTMVAAPMHTDQVAVVEAIAKALPADLQLIVKEHVPMLGRRPAGFYKRLKLLPRVTVLSPDSNGLQLVENAVIVVVITGTAAWDAMRLGVPVVAVGKVPWLAIGSGIIYEPSLENLAPVLDRARKIRPAPDRELLYFVDVCLSHSFELRNSLLWGRYQVHQYHEKAEAVSQIVTQILEIEGA